MCHQKASRSFYIKGNQMPFCCRCTGIWLGITLGLGLTILYRFHENKKYMFLIALGFLPLLVDGFGQLFGFWVSTNLTRFFTGIFAGCVCGIALGIIFEELTQLISIKKYFIKN